MLFEERPPGFPPLSPYADSESLRLWAYDEGPFPLWAYVRFYSVSFGTLPSEPHPYGGLTLNRRWIPIRDWLPLVQNSGRAQVVGVKLDHLAETRT